MKFVKANTLSKITTSSIFALVGTLCCGWFGGNADLESAVYRAQGGTMQCSCDHCKKKYSSHDIIHGWQTHESHPITKISSQKGLVKDVWVVTINWECDKCSSDNDEKKKWKKSEYSYINKKLRWIRDVDEKK